MSQLESGEPTLIRRTWWIALPLVGVLVLTIVTLTMTGAEPIPIQPVKIIASYPHDAAAFTQGLVVEGDVLYEGTGHYGQSTLRRVELKTGQVQQSVNLPAQYFGEGITVLGERIYQLTWKEQTCFIYDKQSLQQLATHRYYEQGWGLTTDGTQLYLSDGTSTIRVLDPENLQQLRRIRVRQGRRLIDNLNELEFVRGELYANVWYSDHIARIDPQDGQVLGWIDCSQVYPAARRPSREHVLNGIAYDATQDKLYITGKNWPQLFEVEVVK